HRTLVRLDEALQDAALVRYAAPCTIVRKSLEQWQLDRSVLENTNFVSPRRIGLRHRAWTYREPGGTGFRNEFNADEDAVLADPIDSLIAQLDDRPQGLTLSEYLSLLVERLAGEGVNARIDAAVRSVEDVSGQAAAAIAAV